MAYKAIFEEVLGEMSYQNMNHRVPPATAPKPYSQNVGGYRPVRFFKPEVHQSGHQTYRQVEINPNYGHSDDIINSSSFPPPPPPDSFSKGYGYIEEEFPPPPPPAPPQSYDNGDSGHPYGNVSYGGGMATSPHYGGRTDDYRPPDYDSVSSQSPPSLNNGPTGYDQNYANIQINIAPPTPPTPTMKEMNGSRDPHDDPYVQMGSNRRAGPAPSPLSSHARHSSGDRPQPGPMVPPGSGQPAYSSQVPSPAPGSYSTPLQQSPPSPPPPGPPASKEAEVDALTDLLMKNMTSASEDENFWDTKKEEEEEVKEEILGICGRCGKPVSGSTNACTALDQVYHIACFTCVGCNAPLQGKSFFAMENKPYCETCYIDSLERCSVCSKPITDRLLRATGKPYHPECFTCVVCGISLDGIPFTVDATNQIHCIECFHGKFAPRCCVCNKPIMPDSGRDETVRIVAMDKSFHVECYRCEDCGIQLSSEEEGRGCYPLDDHILCKNCNAKRIQALTTKMSTEL